MNTTDAAPIKQSFAAQAACIIARSSGLPICITMDTCPQGEQCAVNMVAKMTDNKSVGIIEYIKALWPAGVLFVSFATAFVVQGVKIETLSDSVVSMKAGFEGRTEMLYQLRQDLALNQQRLTDVNTKLVKVESLLEEIRKEVKKP